MPEGIPVSLTLAEMLVASEVGKMRRCSALKHGRVETNNAPVDGGWDRHIEGAAAEMAVAKFAGIYWSGDVGDLWSKDDVGPYQVRASHHIDGRLILHEKDKDDRAFILATGVAPNFILRGWIMGRDGKKPEFWTDPTKGGRAAYFIPQSELHPMETLKADALA